MSAEQHPPKKRGGRQLRREEVARVLGRFRKPKPWPADRVERRDPAEYQKRSEILIRICANPYCRNWTPTRLRLCIVCHSEAVHNSHAAE